MQFDGSLIFLQDFSFFIGWLFGWMVSTDVAGVLQEAENAGSKAYTRFQG